MNIDILNEAIGGIDASIVEEALADGEKKPKVTAFAQRPWLKWAAAAVAIVVIAAGTPLALKAIGSFRNENFVPPNGSGNGNSGVVVPVDSSEPDGSETGSGSAPESENNASSEQSGESRSHGDKTPSGSGKLIDSSAETLDKPDEIIIAGWETPSGESGEFIKNNMPAVTYSINGKNRTFIYQKSSFTKKTDSMDIDGNEVSYSIDYYIDNVGATLIKAGSSEELLHYDIELGNPIGFEDPILESEEDAIKMAKSIALTTDIVLAGLDNASAAARKSGANFYVTLTVAEGKVEVCLNKFGELLNLDIKRNSAIQPTNDRIDAARKKMDAKLSELNNNSSGIYVLDKVHFELWGDKVYAVFSVHYYYNNSDEYNIYDYYCIV